MTMYLPSPGARVAPNPHFAADQYVGSSFAYQHVCDGPLVVFPCVPATAML
jgi:hypothetical protein